MSIGFELPLNISTYLLLPDVGSITSEIRTQGKSMISVEAVAVKLLSVAVKVRMPCVLKSTI